MTYEQIEIIEKHFSDFKEKIGDLNKSKAIVLLSSNEKSENKIVEYRQTKIISEVNKLANAFQKAMEVEPHQNDIYAVAESMLPDTTQIPEYMFLNDYALRLSVLFKAFLKELIWLGNKLDLMAESKDAYANFVTKLIYSIVLVTAPQPTESNKYHLRFDEFPKIFNTLHHTTYTLEVIKGLKYPLRFGALRT